MLKLAFPILLLTNFCLANLKKDPFVYLNTTYVIIRSQAQKASCALSTNQIFRFEPKHLLQSSSRRQVKKRPSPS